MNNLVIVFFVVWFGFGVFIVARWYRRRKSQSCGTDGGGSSPEIPALPGHYRRTMWYFIRCWLGMAAGILVFGLGLHWQTVAVQVFGGITALVGFLGMFGAMSRSQYARCPSCSATMSQGWDEKHSCSDGIFVCPNCQSRWRTRAVWGYE